ncbi:MAG: winged helix-turn-helix transcriptional regulator [Acutalibacteraceae bacterium]|nr:winged helix-turn-helix transcriptional regulator [Acutalibacteraceae bacterium]
MDKIDVKIIECLKKNARENASVIGSQVNMSVSAVIERIKKLEANGIIKQYTVVLDSKKLGMDITAFISVSMEHPKYNNNFNEFVKTPQADNRMSLHHRRLRLSSQGQHRIDRRT